MNVRELFRQKLENSEVIPGKAVRTILMRRLAGREFIRFNPSRFNIYYLGGIVLAGVIATFLVTSSPETSKKSEVKTPVKNILHTDTLSISTEKGQKAKEALEIRNAEIDRNTKNKSTSDNNNHSNGRNIVINPEGKSGNFMNRRNSDSLLKKTSIKDYIADKSSVFNLQKNTVAEFDVSSRSGCTPLKVKFLNRSTAYDSCLWVFGDGGSSTEKNPEWIFDVEGEYKVILKVFGPEGKEVLTYTVITVYQKPVARFEFNPPKPIIPDDAISFVNYSIDAVKYKWEFGDGSISEAFEPDHRYSKYQNFNIRLIVWSEYGCSDSLLVINAFSGSGCYIDFPNAFIPNTEGPAGGYYSTKSDEGAQIFHPVTSGVSDYQLRIFSKMGIIIFESNDVSIGWDGYLKGQLCNPGVYIWKVRGTYKNGEPFVKMGDVTLLKN